MICQMHRNTNGSTVYMRYQQQRYEVFLLVGLHAYSHTYHGKRIDAVHAFNSLKEVI